MIAKLLTEHHLEFLSSEGGCRGSSESTHVKMPHCWKSHAPALIINFTTLYIMLSSTRENLAVKSAPFYTPSGKCNSYTCYS